MSNEIRLLQIMQQCYESGKFRMMVKFLSDNCIWQSDWKTDTYDTSRQIKKYYEKKGKTFIRGDCLPQGALVELFSDANHIMGKGLFLKQTYDGKYADLIIKIELDSKNYISKINLCMKELYRFNQFDVCVPHY